MESTAKYKTVVHAYYKLFTVIETVVDHSLHDIVDSKRKLVLTQLVLFTSLYCKVSDSLGRR